MRNNMCIHYKCMHVCTYIHACGHVYMWAQAGGWVYVCVGIYGCMYMQFVPVKTLILILYTYRCLRIPRNPGALFAKQTMPTVASSTMFEEGKRLLHQKRSRKPSWEQMESLDAGQEKRERLSPLNLDEEGPKRLLKLWTRRLRPLLMCPTTTLLCSTVHATPKPFFFLFSF
mgnify:CR=1 FL=1